MRMSEDGDFVEVEEDEIEAVIKERKFEVGETEVELEDVEAEGADDVTGDREALVNFLIELSENAPDVDLGGDDGDEVEEEEIEAAVKSRDPDNDLIYADSMRDKNELFDGEEWETIDPAEDAEED